MDITYYKKYEPIFGSWHIVREIGEGSFGKVFEIEREDFGQTYKAALKAITIPQSRAEIDSAVDSGMDEASVSNYFRGFVEELVGEFRLMSLLKGESNIVSYEDHAVIPHEDGIGWDILIRMELLTPMIKYAKEKPLGTEDVVRLGIDICKALELCKANNIIHRDIKPENIFVSRMGSFKLGDFGIAKTVEKTTGGMSKKGTYTYMAPEVYKGEEYGSSVDIYSLGIVLYRYLNNNRAPFLPEYPAPMNYKDIESALAKRIGGAKIPAPAKADKALADIILKACAYNPKDRFSSPTEMREALEALTAKPAVRAAAAPAAEEAAEEIVPAITADAPTVSEETVVIEASAETVAEEPLRKVVLPETLSKVDETVVIGSPAASEETVVLGPEGTVVLAPGVSAQNKAPVKANVCESAVCPENTLNIKIKPSAFVWIMLLVGHIGLLAYDIYLGLHGRWYVPFFVAATLFQHTFAAAAIIGLAVCSRGKTVLSWILLSLSTYLSVLLALYVFWLYVTVFFALAMFIAIWVLARKEASAASSKYPIKVALVTTVATVVAGIILFICPYISFEFFVLVFFASAGIFFPFVFSK